jgi:hypothetical protein
MILGHKFAASLLAKAFTDGKIELPHDNLDQLIIDLSTQRRRTYKKYIKWRRDNNSLTTIKTEQELSDWLTVTYRDEFSHIIKDEESNPILNIMGCNSTCKDIDVAVLCTRVDKPLYPGEEEQIHNYMATLSNSTMPPTWLIVLLSAYLISIICVRYSLTDVYVMIMLTVNIILLWYMFIKSYDTTKKIDICYISNVNGTFQTRKGGQETNNIIYHTYPLHDQHSPCIISEQDLVEIDPSGKLISLSKFIMDKAEDMMSDEDYHKIRIKKTQDYHSGDKRFELTFEMLPYFNRDPTDKLWDECYAGFWKSFTMKLVQTYLCAQDPQKYHCNGSHYTKPDMALLFGNDFPEHQSDITNLLLYKNNKTTGFPDETYQFMIELYRDIFNQYYPKLPTNCFDFIPAENCTLLPTELYQEFIISPKKPTSEFINLWKHHYGEDPSTDKRFIEPCQGTENIDYETYPTLKERILLMPQRSEEWKTAYHQTYTCGRSAGKRVIPDTATFEEKLTLSYNLIMGCIGEMIVQKTVSWDVVVFAECKTATIGMIVERQPIDSDDHPIGQCPDQIIIADNEIIPVEIKTIYSETEPSNNNNFIREYNLAKRQLTRAVRLINHGSTTPLATLGVVAYLYIFPNKENETPTYRIYIDHFHDLN